MSMRIMGRRGKIDGTGFCDWWNWDLGKMRCEMDEWMDGYPRGRM